MYFATKPPKRLHGLGDAFLIGRNDLAQVLRVHAGRERRRADQVGEHHSDLAALGGVFGALAAAVAAAAASAASASGTCKLG